MPSAVRPSWNHNPAPRVMSLKRVRFWLICLFFLSWAILIAVRLFWLQVVLHGEFQERARQQQQRTFDVAPRRGVLYDRNLRELAMTVQVDSIFAVPSEIADKQATAMRWPQLSTLTPTTRRLPRSRLQPTWTRRATLRGSLGGLRRRWPPVFTR